MDTAPTPPTNTAANALAQIQSNFNQVLEDWAEIQTLESEISALQSQISNDQKYSNEYHRTVIYNPGASTVFSEMTINHADTEQLHADTVEIKPIAQQVTSLVKQMEQDDPSLELGHLLGALEQINVGYSATGNTDYAHIDTTITTTTADSKKEITSQVDVIKTLCQMISDQIAIDQENAVAGASNGNDTATDVLKSIQLEDPELSLVQNLESNLSIISANATQDSANINQAFDNRGWLAVLFGPSQLSASDKAQIASNKNLVGGIASIESWLTNFVALVETSQAFASLSSVITGIVTEIQTLLADPKFTAATAEKVCGLIQVILGYLQIVLQTAENLRTKNQIAIDKANLQAQQANLKEFVAAVQTISHLDSIQQDMAHVQLGMTLVNILLTVAFIATGNFAAALALGTVTALSQNNGPLQKLQNDIEEHSNQGVATLAVMAITIAGSFAISALVSRLVASASEQAMIAAKAVSTDVEENINTLIANAMKAAAERAPQTTDLGLADSTAGTEEEEMAETSLNSTPAATSAEESALAETSASAEPTVTEQTAQTAAKEAEKTIQDTLEQLLRDVAARLVARTETLAASNAMTQYSNETSLLNPIRLKNLIATANPFSETVAPEIVQWVRTSMNDAVQEAFSQAPALLEKIASGTVSEAEIDTLIEAIAKDASSSANATLRQATDFDAIQAAKAGPKEGFFAKLKWIGNKAQNPLNGAISKPISSAITRAITLGSYTESKIRGPIQLPFGGQALNIIFEIMQGFAQGVMIGKASGCADVLASSSGAAGKVLTGTFIAQIVANVLLELITAVTSKAEGNIDELQANAVKTVDKLQAFNTLARSIFDQTQSAAPSNSPFQSYERHLQQDIAWMEAHQFDGINAGCRVLAEQSV